MHSSNAMKSDNPHSGIYEADTSRTLDLNGGNPSCNQGGIAIVEPIIYTRGYGGNVVLDGVAPTLEARADTGGNNQPIICLQGNGIDRADTAGCNGKGWREGASYTLNTIDRPAVVYQETAGPFCARDYKGVGSQCVDEGKLVVRAVDCRNATEDIVNGALQSNSAHSLNGNNVVRTRYIVRRLTPLECERLQGYPDGWTDIGEWVDSNGKTRQTSDAARYKALGNSIALPPWKWVLKRLCACYERDATMASLFDGIGGFPYLWEQLNGKGSCLWASEIEEFPIAVTKVRIGE